MPPAEYVKIARSEQFKFIGPAVLNQNGFDIR